jgi:hypothetical protein
MAEKDYDDLYRKYGKDQPLSAQPSTNPSGNPGENEDFGLADRMRMSLFQTDAFFDYVKDEPGLRNPLIYTAIISAIFYLLLTITNYMGIGTIPILSGPMGVPQEILDFIRPQFDISVIPFLIMSIFACSIAHTIMSLISAALTHIVARLLSGKGDYASTYKAIAYGGTPSGILGWIPVLGLLSVLWSLYLEIRGVSKLHGLNMPRSALATLLLPTIAILIFGFVLIGALEAAGILQNHLLLGGGEVKAGGTLESCLPCFPLGDISYVAHGKEYLAIRVENEEITQVRANVNGQWTDYAQDGPFPSRSIVTIASEGVFSGTTHVTVEYQMLSSGDIRTADATLNSEQPTE